MKKYFSLILLLLFTEMLCAQKPKADSISQLLAKEKSDTTRATYMWQKASYQYSYAPDSAILIAQQGLLLSKQIKYGEGESRSLGQMANGFLSIGNYTRALEFYIQKLQLEEKRNNTYNLASATMNIGIVYVYEEEYDKALFYLRRADSLITVNHIDKLEYNIKLNIGDVFEKQNITDSAFLYFDNALKIAKEIKDQNRIGMAMTGLGHTYLKQKNYDQSLENYHGGFTNLLSADNEDIMCEAALGLANLYKQINKRDSAIWFARYSFKASETAGFLSRQMDAANFLMEMYSNGRNNTDSAFIYLQKAKIIGDSIYSKEKIRESQVITINEQLRQEEIAANLHKLKEERSQQLQLLLIGLFIPIFFLGYTAVEQGKIARAHYKIFRHYFPTHIVRIPHPSFASDSGRNYTSHPFLRAAHFRYHSIAAYTRTSPYRTLACRKTYHKKQELHNRNN